MGFSFLERSDKSAFAVVSFQIKTWREVVHYAPQPFVDLGHEIGLNTGRLGFAVRTDSADQASRSLIAFKPHFTFHALQNKRSLSLEWPRTPEALSKCPKKSLWYISAWLTISRKVNMYPCSSAKVGKGKSATLSLQRSQTIPNCITDVFAKL